MEPEKFRGWPTKVAICGLAGYSLVYFFWFIIRLGTAYTSGFEYIELNGGWMLGASFLISLSVLSSKLRTMARAIWFFAGCTTLMGLQTLFWCYSFFDVVTYQYTVIPTGDSFWVFAFIGIPAVFCGWIAFVLLRMTKALKR